MRNKRFIFFSLSLLAGLCLLNAQNSTFSPYSRYGLGEIASPVLSHNAGMGGAYIALKPDSTAPIFINTGNPAAYALIKLTTFEVGGVTNYSTIKAGSANYTKWGTNFGYGAVGFPIRSNGGACFGVLPYSHTGYETQTSSDASGIGTITQKFNGDGGLTKAFIGYGIMPFNKRLVRFRKKHQYIPDSLKRLSHGAFRFREFNSKLLSDLSVGFNVNYLFGDIQNTTRVIYPNSLLYNNTLRERIFTMGDFTGNFGLQTAITIDSVRNGKGGRRALKEKIKLVFGYFISHNSTLNLRYYDQAINYILLGDGSEKNRDTAYSYYNQKGTLRLPLEQGVGIGIKKGNRLNIVADFAVTNWDKFRFLNEANDLKSNYRVAAGLNYVPEKYASGKGSYFKRVNYRIGGSYNTGFISIKNTLVPDYNVSLGLGIPVGASRYVSSMVNVSLIYGQMGTNAQGLMKENYWRVKFGFTFADRWFQKFRYD